MSILKLEQGPHALHWENRENGKRNLSGNLEILPKYREFSMLKSSSILRFKDMAIFAAKYSYIFLET